MKLSIILALICIAVFLLEVFSFPLLGISTERFFDDFGFSANNLLSSPWVAISSIFMHADIVHLLSNLLVLFVFGFALEEEIGWRKTLLIFILGAFAGQLFSVFYYAPNIVSVGASAGIFSLIGTGMLVAPFSFKLPNPVPLGLVGIVYAIYNIIGFLSGPSEISYIAHFGGLVVGLAEALHILQAPPPTDTYYSHSPYSITR